jgi:hypothetical protein
LSGWRPKTKFAEKTLEGDEKMGMYTELVFKADVKPRISKQVKDVLNYMFNDGVEPEELPEHPFFECYRWRQVGRCCSSFGQYSSSGIFNHSEFKNYNDEIENFIDWVSPYLDHCDGDCIGWEWYEEYDVPTLIIFGEEKTR